MRSSGSGGQHVNKVSSAIRATHIPTGISALAMDSRSQHQNKKLATQRLKEKFEAQILKHFQDQVGKEWENQLQVQRGNPIRTFTGSDFRKAKTEKGFKVKRQRLKDELSKEVLNENYR